MRDMINVLLVAPKTGFTGGINSWTVNYLENFISNEFNLISLDSSLKHRRFKKSSLIGRIFSGLRDLRDLIKELNRKLGSFEISIMHITTSGSLGTLRDYIVCKLCQKKKIKTIMHCHYGRIPELIKFKSVLIFFTIQTMKLYDQIWVLDSKTEKALKKYGFLKEKIFLIPNSIEVSQTYNNSIKTFEKIAFVGNLIPSKGIYELIDAVVQTKKNVILYIAGNGNKTVNHRIKTKSNEYLGNRIQIKGILSNQDAIKLIKSIDILILPTYYPAEAFPISILEAMSHGKLVISTNRAAIPDILTALDGSMCGILIEERNSQAIKEAIEYCINYPDETNLMCRKAYEKARATYRNEIVFDLHIKMYKSLV